MLQDAIGTNTIRAHGIFIYTQEGDENIKLPITLKYTYVAILPDYIKQTT